MKKLIMLCALICSSAIAGAPKQSGPFTLPQTSIPPLASPFPMDTSVLPVGASYNISCNLTDPNLKSEVVILTQPQTQGGNLSVILDNTSVPIDGENWYQLDLKTPSSTLQINNFSKGQKNGNSIWFSSFDTTETVTVNCTANFE